VATSLLNLWQILKSDLDRVKTRDCHAIRKHEAHNDGLGGIATDNKGVNPLINPPKIKTQKEQKLLKEKNIPQSS